MTEKVEQAADAMCRVCDKATVKLREQATLNTRSAGVATSPGLAQAYEREAASCCTCAQAITTAVAAYRKAKVDSGAG